MVDIRNIVNPHRNCGSEAQLAALVADSEKMGWPLGEVYTQSKKGNEIDAGIASGRKPLKSIIRAMWLFNLAPVDGKAPQKKRAIERRIEVIHRDGFFFREAATGRQSNRAADLVAMSHQAAKMVADYAKGAAGQSRTGRPNKARTEAELDVMRRCWESRRNETVDDAIEAMKAKGIKRVTKGECYRRLGRRG